MQLKVLVPGCGANPLRDTASIQYINIDMEPVNDTVVKHDLTILPYPFPPETFDYIYFFHTIEHLPEPAHFSVLTEFQRLLKPDGRLCVSYPEFPTVAEYYVKNHQGMRDFWKLTIYGRGLTEWDRHKALMDSRFFPALLKQVGFTVESIKPEGVETYNTMVIARKGFKMPTYEELLAEEYVPV